MESDIYQNQPKREMDRERLGRGWALGLPRQVWTEQENPLAKGSYVSCRAHDKEENFPTLGDNDMSSPRRPGFWAFL